MVSLVFTIGLVNFTIGFGLAVYLNRRPMAWRETPIAAAPPAAAIPSTPVHVAKPPHTAVPPAAAIESPPLPPTEEISQAWFDLLSEVGPTNTFVEASVQVLRLEVGRYRDQLIALDARIRRCRTQPDEAAIAAILAELQSTNLDWLARQAEAAQYLTTKRENLGAFSSVGTRLEQILMDQRAQIETTCSNIDVLRFADGAEAGLGRLIVELCRLLDMAHVLRDRMHEALLAIVVGENRLDTIDRALQIDTLTESLNRTGLEVTFQNWWRDDPNRIRQVSLILIDVDRFARINDRHGAMLGDRLLTAFARFVSDHLRQNRGFDAVIRVEGQRFAIFAGDTGPHNATSAIERIRRTLEESTFEIDEQLIELTISCGVTEATPGDTTEGLLRRLETTLREAKRSGRNRTCIDEGAGPVAVEPPDYEVKGKVIRVE